MKIALDVLGGDSAPKSNIQGAIDYLNSCGNVAANLILVGDKKQIEFQNILRAIGFQVRLKPFITRSDGSSKGDWDVGIAIDILEFAPQSDVVVLASGDGDFDILIKKIKNKFNTDSEVYGVPKLTAASLKAAATTFKPINEKLLLR